jgi:hypothetical protein
MRRARWLVVSLVAVAAVAVATSSATSAAARQCGTTPAAARTWSVLATGVSCRDAAALVRRLAEKYRGGSAATLGTQMKMRCLGTSDPRGSRGILCSGAARSVVATSRH